MAGPARAEQPTYHGGLRTARSGKYKINRKARNRELRGFLKQNLEESMGLTKRFDLRIFLSSGVAIHEEILIKKLDLGGNLRWVLCFWE